MAFAASDAIWGADLAPYVEEDVARIATAIAQYEVVSILVSSADRSRLESLIGSTSNINIIEFELNDLWMRDTGPVFVREVCVALLCVALPGHPLLAPSFGVASCGACARGRSGWYRREQVPPVKLGHMPHAEPSFVLYAPRLDPGCCLRARTVLRRTVEPVEKKRAFSRHPLQVHHSLCDTAPTPSQDFL